MKKNDTDELPVEEQSLAAEETEIKSKQEKKSENESENETEAQLRQLQAELDAIQEREKRALADYQNLVRRHRQERLLLAKFANQELLTSLLQPLEHLSLAAEKLDDEGLNMVVNDLWRVLKEEGLEELRPLGEEFDEEIMEAVNSDPRKNEEKKSKKNLVVREVVRPGYKLHDRVLQHAKVMVTEEE